MSKATTEDQIEVYNLELLQTLGYRYTHGEDIAPDTLTPNPSPTGRGASEIRSPSPWEGLGEGFRAKDSGSGYLSLEKRESFSDVLLKDRLQLTIWQIPPL